VQAYGMHPVTFGIVLCLNLAIGFITPPYGVDLFMASAISGVPMEDMMKHVIPFIGALLVVLVLVTFVPWFTLALL